MFIDSLKVIYATSPSAGLRGRAITTVQEKLGDLQRREDFLNFLYAEPEFAADIATKRLRQELWCKSCSRYGAVRPKSVLFAPPTGWIKLWDWVDHGTPRDWTGFECSLCGKKGQCEMFRSDDVAEDGEGAVDEGAQNGVDEDSQSVKRFGGGFSMFADL
jgi:hypothetical protein